MRIAFYSKWVKLDFRGNIEGLRKWNERIGVSAWGMERENRGLRAFCIPYLDNSGDTFDRKSASFFSYM